MEELYTVEFQCGGLNCEFEKYCITMEIIIWNYEKVI